MRRKFLVWEYIKATLKFSFAIWERQEARAVLVGAFISALLAFVSLHGIEVAFNYTFERYYFPILVFLWFVVIVLVVTPYRMWENSQTEIAALRNTLQPLKNADPEKFNGDAYFVFEIEFLWYGLEPPSLHEFRRFATREMDRLWDAIHMAINDKEISAEQRQLGRLVQIEELHRWAQERGMKSKFLFGDEETTDV